MTVLVWIGVGLLGGSAAVARFWLDGLVSTATGGTLPWGTFAVNLTGAFILGLLTGLTLSSDAELLVGTATIGSYTTFSTWMLETHRLREAAEFRWAALNIAGSIVCGVGAAALGRVIGVHL